MIGFGMVKLDNTVLTEYLTLYCKANYDMNIWYNSITLLAMFFYVLYKEL